MSTGGDFGDIPARNFTARFPVFESGITWSTQYSSEYNGFLALNQAAFHMVSNFLTRDILGRTAGICVNPWDFNFVKARTIDLQSEKGSLVGRPQNYKRTSYTPCDCTFRKCDRDFQGLGFTFDIGSLWFGQNGVTGIGSAFVELYGDRIDDEVAVKTRLDGLGFPYWIYDPSGNGGYLSNIPIFNGFIDKTDLDNYKELLNESDIPLMGGEESVLFTYAMIKYCGSFTAGINFKNAITSTLTLSNSVVSLVTGQAWDGTVNGDYDGVAMVNNLIDNYNKISDIPGFSASLIYTEIPGAENLEHRCMCLDAGLYGYDAYGFADWQTVNEQLKVEQPSPSDPQIGGPDKFFEYFRYQYSTPQELAKFLTIDGNALIAAGVTGAKPYSYGPNWYRTWGWTDINVLSLLTPEFKNWEVRDSGKIRMSGSPNGEIYAFGNQWQEWGQRIGSPEIQVVPINPITLGGGDFTDSNFGYKGRIEGSLIYKGRLPKEVLSYESQDYEYAFKGVTSGSIGNTNKTFAFGLTTIRHIDAMTNAQAYGVTGSLEDIIFSDNFSESPQDKTIYRM